jgi:DNA modification methylase
VMRILVGDVREQLAAMPEASVQCCVTSPPYWGLRDYGVPGQIGSERTPEEFVATMVSVFSAVRRVLREDGTLWLNLGDTYNNTDKWGGGGKNTGKHTVADDGSVPSWNAVRARKLPLAGLKPKDLIGIPWRVALALQADGWYLRQEVIWHKPSPMPSSAKDRFCTAHEQIFLLTKKPRYYFDWLAVSEPASGTAKHRGKGVHAKAEGLDRSSGVRANGDHQAAVAGLVSRRMRRTVWKIATKGFKGAHFATYPPALVEPCLLAGTSAHGACAECGAPWRRLVGKTRPGTKSKVNRASDDPGSPYEMQSGSIVGNCDPQRHVTDYVTEGWARTCKCETTDTRPCVVLDPFLGSGTTLMVARSLGLDGIGIELNPDYADMARKRIASTSRPLAGAVFSE